MGIYFLIHPVHDVAYT